MKKFFSRACVCCALISGVFLLAGCGQGDTVTIESTVSHVEEESTGEWNETDGALSDEITKAEEEKSTSVADSLPEKEPELTEEPLQKEDITMEQIIACSNREKLLAEDLMIWNGLQESSLTAESYRQYYYDFVYEENPYRLEFRSDADNTLLLARLVDMQTMLSIDIRTGNIEHLINQTVSMADYLSCDLPERVALGAYDVFLGHFGGVNLEIGEEVCGSILILDGSRVKPVISGGKITKVSEYENNIYHKEAEEIACPAAPAILTLMEVEEDEETTEYYSVYFAEGECNYCYNIRLRTDLFTKEEVLEIINSVEPEGRSFCHG